MGGADLCGDGGWIPLTVVSGVLHAEGRLVGAVGNMATIITASGGIEIHRMTDPVPRSMVHYMARKTGIEVHVFYAAAKPATVLHLPTPLKK